MTLPWSIFCNQENIIWSRKTLYSNFRINNCFSQIPLQSIFEVLFKLISDDFTFNKFVFRTRGSLLLSNLRRQACVFSPSDVLDELARKRFLQRLAFVWVACIITHTSRGSPLSVSHRKCILLSEAECHIINNLLTELVWTVLGYIGPRSWQYGPRRPSRLVNKQLICISYTSLYVSDKA